MFDSGANHSKVLENILQAANKHPNSRVSKLIHNVEEERTQKNIVLLLIELAEHPEYSTDFGISLHYYLDLFEQLGIGRDIVLNEAGLLLLNSSKVYARRVDFVQELVERQILTLSNTEKEMVENRPENAPKNTTEKPKRSRKRLVEAVTDPYEVELVPRKFRKLAEEKRFGGGTSHQDKTKATATKFYQIESEQYIHPAAWTHASIVDLENDEEIDSKRNYKLFTYHVEHRYNTLVPDINFRLHFKVKDYMDEEEERLADIEEDNANDTSNDLADWPPLSEAYIEKYLDLENKVLAIGEILRHRKKPRLDFKFIDQRNISKNSLIEKVQNLKESNESNIECMRELTESINDTTFDLTPLDSGIDSSASFNNTSTFDISTNANSSGLLEGSNIQEGTTRTEGDLSLTNLTAPNSSLDLTQNLNSTEKSLLESQNESDNTIDASNISTQNELTASNVNANSSALTENESGCVEIATTAVVSNDTGLGESINEQSNQIIEGSDTLTNNESDVAPTIACTNENAENHNENLATDSQTNEAKTAEMQVADVTNDKPTDANATENNEKIRVYMPHLDDEGVYFSDLDEHDHRMLSPKVLTTDVFPCIPNKEKITILVDDEIKTLLNIVEEEEPPITYTMPVQRLPATPPLVLNIFKFHEKVLRRRILFKLGPEMDLFLQSRSMKRTHNVDMNETRQYRPMKLFSDSPDITAARNESGMRCGSATDCNLLSDDEEDFLGFTEEEQANKAAHRLSRDSGVDDADLVLTPPFTCSLRVINENLNEATAQNNANNSNNQEIVHNEEKVEESALLSKDVADCICELERELATDTMETETPTTLTVITNDDVANDNCSTDKETTETSPTELVENAVVAENVAAGNASTSNENVAAAIDDGNANTSKENVAAVIDDSNANTLNENVAAVIAENDTNTLQETCDIDDDTTLPESGFFTQDDLLDMDNLQEVEKSKTKIQKWHEYLQPILTKARDRHHFDVFQLGTEIMNELQKPMPSTSLITTSTITFQDVMTAKDESYVSRYFLSTLLLANQNNIKINVQNKCTEKPSSWDDIKLDLLDTKRHTVAIEDNIGIINTKAITTTDTTKRKQKKSSSIINEAVCSGSSSSSSMNANLTNSELLNVNINVVRPLKQVEKLTNTNDDYDSGIFSNEDYMS